MKYYSTNKSVPEVSFEEAIFKGLPDDNGLYMPDTIHKLDQSFFDNIENMSLAEIGYEVASKYIEDEIPAEDLKKIVAETMNFDIPAVKVEEGVYSLELYHGPTLAFKDVGARFLARCLSYFSGKKEKKATILVATSGDTGAAVGAGFYGMENINVVILYPGGGKISKIQEKQLTTLGGNITACEVDGTFDDCQKMVKDSFLNPEMKDKFNLTSANSINMARLIPQSFYYFWTYAQLKSVSKDIVICVPSGNYGNLTAGLLAKKMGLPIRQYIAASNANDIVPAYIQSGQFNPKPSVMTMSNAMDVGNPSNFFRMNDLFGASWDVFKEELAGYAYDDKQTGECIKQVKDDTGYLLDPHGAVGYLGLKEYMNDYPAEVGVFLETAHPAKFGDVVEPIINEPVVMPDRLKAYAEGTKVAEPIKADVAQLRVVLEKVSN
ncbi:threonine synthase [Reichenbachiella versicolor]|uniref:threonine synthase n=1 Tax=Reichenbachiella versicolor TaxID=1821036 RepID=UPI000D6E48E8|nr:threonine synthase [Reichenbachiella versicolor]